MNFELNLSRARFLRLSAITAVTGIVTACAGPTAAPTTAPAAPTATTGAAKPTTAPATAPTATTAAGAPTATTAAGAPTATTAATAAAAKPTTAPGGAATATPASSASIGRATPIVFTGTYKESPLLTAQVTGGKLPAVKDRLPEKPYVVPHKWLTPGNYGGWIQMATVSKDDTNTWRHVQESMYGHSPLRWLKDGLEIGPGLVENWETNADLSDWTLYWRKGLKWSDGQPFNVDDVLFWWEDEVQNPDLQELPPDEARSGKGTLVTMKKVDDNTLKMTFDAPAPLTADRLAMWVNRGVGPRWMDPKHYLTQFHPKYNDKVDKTNWVDTFVLQRQFQQTPACPTMTGWMLEAYNKGQNTIWVRNPYYWCIDKDGNQLPYLDGLTMTNVQDAQVFRLRVSEGQVDYVHGNFSPLGLADVQTIKANEAKSKLAVWFWDGGGGGDTYFFSYDYKDEKYRTWFRNPRFLKAFSIATNRPNIQKVVYYGTGELTTGTMSPKALEFNVTGGKEVYQSWRDSAKDYNPDKAKSELDALGFKDVNGDGFREFPDGSKFQITVDYHADADPAGGTMKRIELWAKDWQAIGIDAKPNPIPPASWTELWNSGGIMNDADWGVGDGPNCLVYPQWLVPMEATRWAPLEGKMYEVRGTPAFDQQKDLDPFKRTPPRMEAVAGGPIEKLWQLYDQTKIEPDATKRTKLVWDIVKIHVDSGPFFTGAVANTPTLVVVKAGLKNVPQKEDLALGGFTGPWIIPAPAVYDPEAYYWDKPDDHKRA